MANVSSDRSRNIERFLNHITAKQSQGLPVGPFGSILLAEACLIDVDNFLRRQDVQYVRYVDDFRVFCSSRKHCIEVRHGLPEYLFEVHRLLLESSKTSVRHVIRFLAEELSDPEESEQQAKVDKLNELLNEFATQAGGVYWDGDVPLEPDENELLGQAEKESFKPLFEQCLRRSSLQIGLARHLLRRARRSKTAVLNEHILNNLEVLSPVMRDVVACLIVTILKKQAQDDGQQLMQFCANSDIANLRFVRMWILDLLFRRPDLCEPTQALLYAETSVRDLGICPSALLATAHTQIDWVRARKETWRNHNSWDRRALIWSSSILPRGERRPFLSMVVDQGDPLDVAVAKHLLSKSNPLAAAVSKPATQ